MSNQHQRRHDQFEHECDRLRKALASPGVALRFHTQIALLNAQVVTNISTEPITHAIHRHSEASSISGGMEPVHYSATEHRRSAFSRLLMDEQNEEATESDDQEEEDEDDINDNSSASLGTT